MSGQLVPFNNPGAMTLSPEFAAANAESLAALKGGVTGVSINRMSLKGGRFRFQQGGTEIMVLEGTKLEAVIIDSTPHASRIFFAGKYNENADKARPTCWATTGIAPDADVPANQRQANSCAACPQNQKGSADDGKSKKCAYKKHMVIVAPNDLKDGAEPVPYLLDLNSQSMYAPSEPHNNLYSLQGYTKDILEKPKAGFPNGVAPLFVVTLLSLDLNSSTPKLFFSPVAFMPNEMCRNALKLRDSEQVKFMMSISGDESLVDTGNREGGAVQQSVAGADQAPAPVAKVHWKFYAEGNGMDADDIQIVLDAGGPSTEKGRRMWDKLIGLVLDDTHDLALEPTKPKATRAPAAAKPAAPPPPPPKQPWKDYAAEGGADPGDIEMVDDAGGPTTEKGARLWGKLIGLELHDGIDTGALAAAPKATPAPAAARAGRKPPASPAQPAASAGSTTAPAQPRTTAPSQAASPVPNGKAGGFGTSSAAGAGVVAQPEGAAALTSAVMSFDDPA